MINYHISDYESPAEIVYTHTHHTSILARVQEIVHNNSMESKRVKQRTKSILGIRKNREEKSIEMYV